MIIYSREVVEEKIVMAIKLKKMLSTAPAEKSSLLEMFISEKSQTADGVKTTELPITNNLDLFGEIPLFNIRWYPSSKSCVRISTEHRQPQNTPPLMVRKAEWRR